MASQKSVLITGCSKGGIGDALAQEFHSRGLKVFATARNPAKVQHLKEMGMTTLTMDITSRKAVEDAVVAVTKRTDGKLDFLILNAGSHVWMPFTDHTVDAAREMLENNVLSIYIVTQPFLPLLIRAKGLIATIGSLNQALSPPYQSSYNACKHAIHGLTDTMRTELTPLGVRVVNVVTGSVATGQHEGTVKLPDDSYYVQIKEEFESKQMMRQGWRQQPADYAKRVVGDLMQRNPGPSIWRGGMSTTMWLLTTLVSRSWLDGMFLRSGGLANVTAPSL